MGVWTKWYPGGPRAASGKRGRRLVVDKTRIDRPRYSEEDEEEDDLIKEEPKAKNPLDSLPKSTFNLEDWKRAYSNKETRGAGGSLEWFYQK